MTFSSCRCLSAGHSGQHMLATKLPAGSSPLPPLPSLHELTTRPRRHRCAPCHYPWSVKKLPRSSITPLHFSRYLSTVLFLLATTSSASAYFSIASLMLERRISWTNSLESFHVTMCCLTKRVMRFWLTIRGYLGHPKRTVSYFTGNSDNLNCLLSALKITSHIGLTSSKSTKVF